VKLLMHKYVWYGLCHFPISLFLGSIGSQAMRPHTCLQLSTRKLDIENLVSYERQDGPVQAIMFIDNKGIKICVSPNRRHAQVAIKKIDQKRAAKTK
ncbi:XCL1 protein, partial [Atlantisia rogersi]|nr:XCL1 protein [Atlantisia rogersi]